MSVNTQLLSDPYSSLNTSQCNNQDVYDFNFVEVPHNWLNELLIWEGGITFNVVYWSIILLFSFAVLYFLRWKCRWPFLIQRFDGQDEPTRSNWILSIDEEVVGKDGATYLWFQVRQMIAYTWILIISIVLIIVHRYGDKQGDVKNLNSTTLYNIGVNGIHCVFCLTVLVILDRQMYNHGLQRGIRSFASPRISDRVCNRRWLMISGLPLTTTVDSLFDDLKNRFDLKGICRENIHFVYDLNSLWPVKENLKLVREIKRTLLSTGPQQIQTRFWECFSTEETPGTNPDDALTFYSEMEKTLLDKRDDIMNNLQFVGIAFIGFDSPAEAKATKSAVKQVQRSTWFGKDKEDDQEFRPSIWTIGYAPPGSEMNWPKLQQRPPLWKNLIIWLVIIFIYFGYIAVMAAPGYIVQSFRLVGRGTDEISLTWQLLILPHLGSFFTRRMTDFVTKIDEYRHHTTVPSIELGKLHTVCHLSAVLYLIRMMAMKPLPLVFAGQFDIRDIRWECLFFPEHGSFLSCAIIVNTASGVLMNHTRLEFLISYLLKWFTCRSEAELTVWRQNYRLGFDFTSNYAELTSNFGLTMLIFIIFPVLGVISWICCIVRFVSDRAAMMEIYAVSQTSADLHREPINMTLNLVIFSPLVLLGYRIIQLGPNTVQHLVESTFLAPLCVAILYALYLIDAHVRFHWQKVVCLHRLFGYIDDDVEESDMIDNLNNILHEYDPLAKIRQEEMSYNMTV
ncbi:calcium permeable stress-gated cation channel 1-like [Daphnia carinata]|uniref:calcium permeable stress-gated cation channel 1-like n=1 Tax=Daphnia carinata TaxID=120202 RepID=UPI002868D5B5|nr:calcium permeable stress-gated cation channel 1-like [Daphnia carinata]